MPRPHLEVLEDRWMLATVTNLLDAGPGSLREAIALTASGGTVDFQSGLSGTISLLSGELTIAKDLIIAGPGANVLAVSGNNAFRVFRITSGVTATISGLTIANGLAVQGGGIHNDGGVLTVERSTISNNNASGGFFGW